MAIESMLDMPEPWEELSCGWLPSIRSSISGGFAKSISDPMLSHPSQQNKSSRSRNFMIAGPASPTKRRQNI
jgi:hypothetical protein